MAEKLSIKIADSEQVLRTMQDVLDFLDQSAKKLKELEKQSSVTDAILNPKEANKIQLEINKLTKTIDNVHKTLNDSNANGTVIDPKEIEKADKAYEHLKKQIVELNTEILKSSKVDNTPETLSRLLERSRTQSVKEARESVTEASEGQLSTPSSRTVSTAELDNQLEYMDMLRERQLELEANQVNIFDLQRKSTQELKEYVDEYNFLLLNEQKSLEFAKGQQKSLVGALSTLEALRAEQAELSILIAETNNPTIQKELAKRRQEVTESIERQTESLGNVFTTEELILGLQEREIENDSTREVSINKYKSSIRELAKEQEMLAVAMGNTTDPSSLELLKRRHEEITDEIKNQNTAMLSVVDTEELLLIAGESRVESNKRIAESQKETLNNIYDLKKEQQALLAIAQETNDPQVLELVRQKQAQVTEQLKEQQDLYDEMARRGADNDALRERSVSNYHATIKELGQEQDALVLAMGRTTDPSKLDELRKRHEEVTSELENQISIMSELADANEILLLATEQEVGFKERMNEMQAMAMENIVALNEEQQKLNRIAKKANDPRALEVIAKKQEKITAELEAQQRIYDNIAKNKQTQSIGTSQQGLASLGGGIGSAGAGLASISVLVQAVEAGSEQLDELAGSLAGFDEETGKANKTLGEIILNVAEFAEQFQTSMEKVKTYQEGLSNMSNSLTEFSDKTGALSKSFANAGKTGASALSGLSKGASMLSSGAGMFAKLAGPIGAAVAGIELAFGVLDSIMGKTSADIEQRMENIRRNVDLQMELGEIAATGDRDELERKKKQIEEQIKEQERLAEATKEQAGELTDGFNMFRSVIGNTFFGDTTLYGQAGDAIRDANKETEQLKKELEKLQDEGLLATIARVEELNKVASEAEETVDEMNSRQNELFSLRYEMLRAEDSLMKDLASTQADFDEESLDLQEKRDDEDRNRLREHLAEIDTMNLEYQQEVQDTTYEHLSELNDLYNDFQDELAEAVKDHQENLNEMDIAYRESRAEAIMEFREEQIEAQEDYDKTLAKMQEDYNKEKIKREKDLQAQLFEAEIGNDALRFFMLQRQGEEEAKEAEDQFQESLSDEEKAFQEKKAESWAQHQEELADAKAQYEEERAEEIASHQEAMRLRREQYAEELQQSKDAHAENLKQMQEQHTIALGLQAKQFDEAQKELEIERTREDADRITRLAERRQEMVDAFQLELDYFAQREAVLMDFIDDVKAIRAKGGSIDRIKADGAGTITSDDAYYALQSLNTELENLTAIGADADQIANVKHYRDMFQEIYDEGIKNINLDAVGQEVVKGAIQNFRNIELAEEKKNHEKRLEYTTDEQIQLVNNAETWANTNTITELFTGNLANLGLTMNSMMTADEQQKQEKRYREIIESEGEQNLDVLTNQVKDVNSVLISASDGVVEETATNKAKNLELWSDFFYQQSSEQIAYQDDSTSKNKTYLSELADNESEYGVGRVSAQETVFNTLAEGETLANESSLERQAEHDEFMTEQDVLNKEGEVERNLTQQELLNEIWLSFFDEFEGTINDAMKDVFRDIARDVDRSANQVVNVYQSMNQSIVSQAKSGLSQLQSMMSSMSRYSMSASRYGSSSGGSGMASASSLFRGLSGTMAAKGALIDEPTLLIAGEGDSPELVMPFDESKGIPKDFMTNMSNQIQREVLPTVKVGGGDSQAMYAMMKQMQANNKGFDLNIGDITIGGNMTRAEVRQQFQELHKTLIDVFQSSIEGR